MARKASANDKLYLLLPDKTLEEVPEGRVIGELRPEFGPRHLAIHGVTLPAGGLWHFDAEQVAESPLIRVLDEDEVRSRTQDGVIASSALQEEDPVTGLTPEDYEEAAGPIRQLAADTDDDGRPIAGTVAEE